MHSTRGIAQTALRMVLSSNGTVTLPKPSLRSLGQQTASRRVLTPFNAITVDKNVRKCKRNLSATDVRLDAQLSRKHCHLANMRISAMRNVCHLILLVTSICPVHQTRSRVGRVLCNQRVSRLIIKWS